MRTAPPYDCSPQDAHKGPPRRPAKTVRRYLCRSAVAHSLQRTLEEHSYFAAVYSLGQRYEVAKEYIPRVLAPVVPLPTFLLRLMTPFFHSQFVRTLHGQVCLQK